jgi:hypothetical protein
LPPSSPSRTSPLIAGAFGRLGWNLAFVDGRSFRAWYGLDWSILISGWFDLLFFFAMGMVVANLVGGSRRIGWALAFGLLDVAIRLLLGRNSFAADAEWYVYLPVYLQFIFAPLGAAAGGAAHQVLVFKVTSVGPPRNLSESIA